MDAEAVIHLRSAGIDVTMEETFPGVGIKFDNAGKLQPLEDEILVMSGDHSTLVRLRRISELFTGNRRPPDFNRGPTEEYVPFFVLIERTAIDFCRITRTIVKDQEFERLYHLLRRRPDGRDPNLLFSYLQGAARLYMSLRDVSRAEFEAVAGRLGRSARHFADGYSSANYYRVVGEHMP